MSQAYSISTRRRFGLSRNVSTTLRQRLLDFRLGSVRLALVG